MYCCPLCTKRKTGSKQVITWLTRLGHGISYDDVLYMETGIAEQQIQYQLARNFVPSIIQPSKFVTFIWDNNDINPESLSGISMHCTNGIIVQMIEPNTNIATPNRNHQQVGARRRSFKCLPSKPLLNYITKNRVDPATFPGISMDFPLEDMKTSSYIDLIWVLLRHKSSKSGRQIFPAWTGFNSLLEQQKSSAVHQVASLPAIDQSPTSFETSL